MPVWRHVVCLYLCGKCLSYLLSSPWHRLKSKFKANLSSVCDSSIVHQVEGVTMMTTLMNLHLEMMGVGMRDFGDLRYDIYPISRICIRQIGWLATKKQMCKTWYFVWSWKWRTSDTFTANQPLLLDVQVWHYTQMHCASQPCKWQVLENKLEKGGCMRHASQHPLHSLFNTKQIFNLR